MAALALWVYALITTWLVGRSSRPAGILLWLPFGWQSFLLVSGFELMRLNSGGPLTASLSF